MLLDIIKKDATSRSVELKIIDSTTGVPVTTVAYNTSGIDLWYRREAAAKVSITEATLAALTTAWSSGGFLHISDGIYRLDVPDAAFATGVNWVYVGGTVTGMVVIGGRVKLVNYDPEDAVRMGLTALPNAAAEAAGGLYTRGSGAGQINQANNGQVDSNAARLGGTTQTGRDIGASVLLSTGTGTGQLDFTSGVVKANLAQILGTALTETAGLLAGGFKKFFNIASPVSTMDVLARVTLTDTVTTYTGNTPQTGDNYVRIGAPAGVSVSADVAAVKTDTGNLITRIPAALFANITSFSQWLGLIAGKQVGNSTARTEVRATGAGSGTFDETTDSQEALRDRGDSAWITGTAPDNSGIAAIKVKTDQLVFTTASQVDATAVTVSDKAGYALASDFRIKKNTALNNFTFLMVNASGDPATALTITAQRSLDGGALGAMANSATEISNGLYKINLATADTNADFCAYRFSATGAKDRIIAFPTQTE